MPNSAFVFGLLSIGGLLWIRTGAYFDGLAFEQSFFYPMVIVPIILLCAPLFVIALIVTIVSLMRRKTKFRRMWALGVLGLAFLGYFIFESHMPTFADGMSKAVHDKLQRERLLEFAVEAKTIAGVEPTDPRPLMFSDFDKTHSESIEQFEMMKAVYPEAFELNRYSPRIYVSSDAVRAEYGSALTKHYGYAVVDQDNCPIDPAAACKRVFENVWVYLDIY